MKRVITIEIEGDEEGDLELALGEALSRIKQGYTSGHDANDTGRFNFDVTDSE